MEFRFHKECRGERKKIEFNLPQNKPLKSYGSIIVTFLISFNLFNVRVRVSVSYYKYTEHFSGQKINFNPAACFLMVFFNEIKGKKIFFVSCWKWLASPILFSSITSLNNP